MIPLVFPMPVLPDGRRPLVTSAYGPRIGGMTDFHHGVDILYPRSGEPAKLPWTSGSKKFSVPDADIGLAVPALAAAAGVVTRSSWTHTGARVRIDHGDGISTGYFHLRNRMVKVGDRVKAGQPVGITSFNPWARGAPPAQPPPAPPRKIGLNHLHFELYKNGKDIDPRRLIEAGPIPPFPSSGSGWVVGAALAIGAGLLASKFIR